MSKRTRLAGRIALIGVATLIVVLATAVVFLTFPRTPGTARSVHFQGFVSLPTGPNSKLLTVLDYMSVGGRDLFVTNVSTGAVYKIALRNGVLPTGSDISTFETVPAAHGVVIDPKSGLAFVTRSKANTVDVFDPSNMRLIKRIPVADDPDAIFFDPVDQLVYAASGDAGMATLIDPATQKIVGTIPLGGKPEFGVFDTGTKLFYQNLKDTNSVAVVDIAKRAVVQRWPLAKCVGPTGMDIDDANHRLFIACGQSSTLIVLDLNKHQIIASLPIGTGPDAVAFDPVLHRIYSIGLFGTLSVVQQITPDTYRPLDLIQLHFAAHTLAVDPNTHRLYVGYASLFVPPRIAVFSPIR